MTTPYPVLHEDEKKVEELVAIPTTPDSLPEPPPVTKPAPPPPPKETPKSPSEAAREVLDQFLAAKTLAERLPFIESRMPEDELAKSCLAAPLLAARNISIDSTQSMPAEQILDFYHNVDFETENQRLRPHAILVRIRGSARPKIMVDPFLDSYGGRLESYAKYPSDQPADFQVIVWPLASCFDERVPNHADKLTLKLLPQDNTKEIALAYFGKQSQIARMLDDDLLRYGRAKACTVTLRWNKEERPKTSYLEVTEIKALDWNP